QPAGPQSQRLTSSGFVHASNTSLRGAPKTRVIAISSSDGVVIFSIGTFASITPLLSFHGVLVLPAVLRAAHRGAGSCLPRCRGSARAKRSRRRAVSPRAG